MTKVTLEELLKRRGVRKSEKFGDYQDFIEEREGVIKPSRLNNATVIPSGSMHIALDRLISTIGFRW